MMAEAPSIITLPQVHSKKKKNKVNINNAIVLNSVAPTVPIAVPAAAPHLEDSRSNPSSPERGATEGKKSKNFFKKLSRPRSPRHRRKSHSDPETSSASPSPQPRPKQLLFKKRKSPDHNGDTAAAQQDNRRDGTRRSHKASELEATPVEMLPGRTHPTRGGSDVPEIRVSSEGHDEPTAASGGMVSYEEISGGLDPCDSLDPYRKNSQSSRCSSGVGTSGFGSLLSPSGDDSSSDIESPLSPYSGASSFTEEAQEDISDLDPIDKDYSMAVGRKSASIGSNDNLTVTTPTPTSESPPNRLDSSSVTLVSPTSPDGKDFKKKKDKDSKGAKVRESCVWCVGGVACRSLGNISNFCHL